MLTTAFALPRSLIFPGLARRSLLPVTLGVLALALRLHGLADKPYWLDEITTVHRSGLPLGELAAEALRNRHSPTYFLLMHALLPAGSGVWLFRLPSAVLGALCAPLACLIGRVAAGERAATIAGLLLALSPVQVQFSQEARSYTLVTCLILVALWGLARLAADPAGAARPILRDRSARGAWLAYVLGTAAALDVLSVAIPWLLAANLAAIAIARRCDEARAGFWRNWALAQAVILAAWLPLLLALSLIDGNAVLSGVDWAPPESLTAVWSVIAAAYLQRIASFITPGLLPAAVPGLEFAILALLIAGIWRLRHRRPMVLVLASAGLALPATLLLVSAVKPALVLRYFIWSAAPLFVLAGAGLDGLSRRRFAAAAAVLGILGFLNLAPYYGAETKPRWDLAAAAISGDAQPGDVVLLDDWLAEFVFRAFAGSTELDERHILVTHRVDDAAQRLAGGGTVWAVHGRVGQAPMESASAHLRRLAGLGAPAATDRIGRYLRVWRFVPSKKDGGIA
ncbi:MAG TPA: hypothetical protein VMC10_08910 [Stellaceae bacterium]|nr:hypothetical protein [Stellaceae bacterium]